MFYEITKNAVREAVDAAARDRATNLVNAYQARRALDYLVGFNLSPLLWKKIRPRALRRARAERGAAPDLRARGRDPDVQAARVLDRSRREAAKDAANFPAGSREFGGEKVEQFTVTDAGDADAAERELELQTANGRCSSRTSRRSSASAIRPPPFTTSTLQQEAARKLGFGAQRTMQIAQRLYEGVDFGEGPSASSPTCVPIR